MSKNDLTPFPYAEHIGSNPERQSIGDPGHCERCLAVGHVAAHPDLGCGDVGCEVGHSEVSHHKYWWCQREDCCWHDEPKGAACYDGAACGCAVVEHPPHEGLLR